MFTAVATLEPKTLPEIRDARGALSFAEVGKHLPFVVQRIFCLYDTASGASRGGHAHKTLHQYFLAPHGAFEVHVDDGRASPRIFVLDRPNLGLHVPPGLWVDVGSFFNEAVCLVLTSAVYDEADYIRNRSEFLQSVQGVTA